MGGSSLKELPLAGYGRREPYRPGDEVRPISKRKENPLASALVDDFLDDSRPWSYPWERAPQNKHDFSKGVMHCQEIIEESSREDLDLDALLEDILLEIYEREGPDKVRAGGILLDATMQELYNRGHNDFTVNTGPFTLDTLGNFLTGKLLRKLRITIEGDVQGSLGYGMKHCDVLFDGNARHAFSMSHYVRVVVRGHAKTVGDYALASDFTVPSAEMVADSMGNCRFFVENGDEEQLREMMNLPYKEREFTGNVPVLDDLERMGILDQPPFLNQFRRNKVYVPVEDGKWKRVRP